MRDDWLRFEDIRDAIEAIEWYAVKGRRVFEADELIAVWILHHLEIIGEACNCHSPSFRAAHPDDLWADAATCLLTNISAWTAMRFGR